jgi:hypothetical protein
MTSPLLFRPARDDELANMLRLAGIDLFVLADVCDRDPVACVLVRAVDNDGFEVCAIAQRGDADEDVVGAEEDLPGRIRTGVADWLRARGAQRLDDVEL